RKRFEHLLSYDVALRHMVGEWESRLMPLSAASPEVEPPARVWRAIEARTTGRAPRGGLWHRHGWFRGLSAAGALAAIVLATVLVLREPAPESIGTVAVLSDAHAQPAMLVTWPLQNKPENRHIRIKMLAQTIVPASKSLELWMLPGGQAAPISLGV